MIGKPVRRREDERLVRGRGQYVADCPPNDSAHLALVRSPHASARIRALDVRPASGIPGVLGVLTGDDWRAAGFGKLPCIWQVDSRDGSAMNEAPREALAPLAGGRGRVRHVGEIVAAVVAASAREASDAAEVVDVDYEPLAPMIETALALAPGAPLVHEDLRTNLCFDIEFGDRAAATRAIERAHHVTALELINNRVAPSPLEPRATIGVHDAADERYTLWTSSQNPHLVRRWLAEDSLHIPEHRIRVISPDVGGGFGQKIAHYPEEPIVLWAAQRFGRPVAWTGTRSENLMEDTQARDHVTRCRM